MTQTEILASNLSKAEKARRLYDLGLTRHQVADLVCGGNYGWAHNIFAKHTGLQTRTRISRTVAAAVGFAHKFGVEIECFGVSQSALAQALNAAGIPTHSEYYNHTTRSHWKIVSDGSVTGPDAMELVSPVLQGEAGMAQVEKVCEVLERLGAKVNKSCGLHVHFDARTLSIDNWKSLYKNYLTLEGEIDSIMPISRRMNNNQFCRSLSFRNRTAEATVAAIDRATTVAQLSTLVAGTRYVKLNAESYQRHGTVEFRQHSGTVEFQKIGNWIRICGALIDKSKTASVSSLSDFLPENLLTYVNQRKRKFAVC